jgi:cytochrome o ubiquinol oxidase operon protein cyoD
MSSEIPLARSEHAQEAAEQRSYCIGVCFALILTLAAFAVVWLRLLTGTQAVAALGALALVQIVVHLRYFMHIDLEKSHRDDLLLILFTVLIVLIIVAGTIWILWNQHMRMMMQ